MSMYVHRCQRCGHIEQAHDQRTAECSANTCKCDVRSAIFGGPELVPTFDPLTGARRERLFEPGALLGSGVLVCSCEACVTAVSRL